MCIKRRITMAWTSLTRADVYGGEKLGQWNAAVVAA
jgi:hypothetical protein